MEDEKQKFEFKLFWLLIKSMTHILDISATLYKAFQSMRLRRVLENKTDKWQKQKNTE